MFSLLFVCAYLIFFGEQWGKSIETNKQKKIDCKFDDNLFIQFISVNFFQFTAKFQSTNVPNWNWCFPLCSLLSFGALCVKWKQTSVTLWCLKQKWTPREIFILLCVCSSMFWSRKSDDDTLEMLIELIIIIIDNEYYFVYLYARIRIWYLQTEVIP